MHMDYIYQGVKIVHPFMHLRLRQQPYAQGMGQGAVAQRIARSALETEFVGSNPGHGEVVFLWAFFFFFLPYR